MAGWSKRRPYLGTGENLRKHYFGTQVGTRQFYAAPVRWLHDQNIQESQFEKPYLDSGYRSMHLNLPRPRWTTPGFSLDDRLSLSPLGVLPSADTWHLFIFPPPLCWAHIFSPVDCDDVTTGVASLMLAPPRTENVSYDWKIIPETENVTIEDLRESFLTDSSISFKVVPDGEYDGVVTVCIHATQVTGISTLMFEAPGPPWHVPDALGEPLTPSTVAGVNLISYASGGSGENVSFPCGCFDIVVNCCIADDGNFEYDRATSDDTIARSSTATIAIDALSTNSPFVWQVAGTGFYFDAGYSTTSLITSSVSVTLYADNTACGQGVITVTGCDGVQTTGCIRCTTGSYSYDGEVSQGAGCGGCVASSPTAWATLSWCNVHDCTVYQERHTPGVSGGDCCNGDGTPDCCDCGCGLSITSDDGLCSYSWNVPAGHDGQASIENRKGTWGC